MIIKNMTNNKHAFLIMAHHRMDLLQLLLDALDHESCDFYVHIDIKCKEEFNTLHVNKGHLYFIKRMDVRWAGYSQIECELNLIKAALDTRIKYQYLHLLTGACYPIKPINDIIDFFNKNSGKEFVGFDSDDANYYIRVKDVFLFNEIGKPSSKLDYVKIKIRNKFVSIQEKLKFDRFKKYNLIYKKGIAYFSITLDCARFVYSKKKLINKIFKYSISGDEVFLQTIVFNSNFNNNLYDLLDEYNGCQVAVCWKKLVKAERTGNNFLLVDYQSIVNSNCLFALKFEGEEGINLINKIKNSYIL